MTPRARDWSHQQPDKATFVASLLSPFLKYAPRFFRMPWLAYMVRQKLITEHAQVFQINSPRGRHNPVRFCWALTMMLETISGGGEFH